MLFTSTAALTILLLSSCQYWALTNAGNQTPFRYNPTESSHEPFLDDDFATWLTQVGYNWGMKGVAIAVTRKSKTGDGWMTETKGYGVADRWGNTVDDETLFSIASNSKLFTALGVGLMTVNQSIYVDWETKIKNILPNSLWALQDPIAQEHANLVDILTHRTGLPRHDLSSRLSDTSESVTAKLRYLRPSAEFREIWQYNNQMYTVAAHIISRLTGTPFDTYITRNIISPLGLNFTTYNAAEARKMGKIADGFVNTGEDDSRGEGRLKLRFRPIPFWNEIEGMTDLDEGPGGIISNAKDMATWLQALLLSGKSPSSGLQVIPSSLVDRVAEGVMVVDQKAEAPELSPSVYGMGQARYTYQGHELIEHSGATIGHYSVITRAPNDGVGIAVLSNADGGNRFLDMVKWRLLEKSLGLPEINWDERFRKREEEPNNSTGVSLGPSERTPSTLPNDDLAGTYFNPAYGTISLCPYPPSSRNQPSRKECEGAAPEALRKALNESPPALIASWSSVWFTHVFLHHVSGDEFRITPAMTFPAPFPDSPRTDDDSHPFAVFLSEAITQFVFGSRPGDATKYVVGVACKGAWGAAPGIKEPKGEGKEGAEIWFDRVI